MQMDKVWKVSTGKGVKVAVVDTGVDDSTPSLQGQLLPGEDRADAPGGPNDDDVGHGTTVAELIAGTGKGGGLKGLAPDSKIIPIRAALEGVKGGGDKSRLDISMQAIRAAVESDAQIINLSFGQENSDGVSSEVVKYAASKGKLVFASTGNDGEKKERIEYPAAYAEVVAVGASNEKGKVSKFSQWAGPDDVDDVDLVAPGENMPRLVRRELSSAIAKVQTVERVLPAPSLPPRRALIWSKHPDWTANQVLRVMIDTAGRESKSNNPSKYIGWGAVRPRMNLVEGEGDPGNPAVSPLTGKKTGPANGPEIQGLPIPRKTMPPTRSRWQTPRSPVTTASS